jgi:hypothetical protein
MHQSVRSLQLGGKTLCVRGEVREKRQEIFLAPESDANTIRGLLPLGRDRELSHIKPSKEKQDQ